MEIKFLLKKLTGKISFFSLISLLASGLITSCKDKSEDDADNCIEGRGGQLTLIFQMIHHTRPIKGGAVFLKYNATEFPGEDTSLYDYSVSALSNSSFVSVDSLSCGNYYIYAVGIDSLLDPVSWTCKGGIPYSTSSSSGTDTLRVYITEGD